MSVTDMTRLTDSSDAVDTLKANLSHAMKLVRSKGIEDLRAFAPRCSQEHWQGMVQALLALTSEKQWEARCGAFGGLCILLEQEGSRRVPAETVAKACLGHVDDTESRVRSAVAECILALAKRAQHPSAFFDQVYAVLLPLIQRYTDRSEAEAQAELDVETNTALIHDTEGWKSLETCFITLECLLRGCKEVAGGKLDANLVELIYDGLRHTNRFVRETCQFILRTICELPNFEATVFFQDKVNRERLVSEVAKGLGDNWSQVRYAASTAARSLLQSCQYFSSLTCQEMRILVPPMCLNRYYVAAGVRVYSIDTWKAAFGTRGRHIVADLIADIVPFYLSQANADNHAVREAVCFCIGELASKLPSDPVRPYVPLLLDALIACFKDQSWPVRDSAAAALGDFVACFPDESQHQHDELFRMWIAHLSDNIASVREDTAVALGKVARSMPKEAEQRLLPVLDAALREAEKQPKDSQRFAGLNKSTLFGVASPADEQHTNQQMYSCGSLAPKLKRGAGCMDHGFERPKEPWESTDGALYLLRELAQVFPAHVGALLSSLGSIAALDHFKHHVYLKETVWKQVAVIATRLEPAVIESAVPHLASSLIVTLGCGHQLAEAAALHCIKSLASVLGTSTAITLFDAAGAPIPDQIRSSLSV